LKHYDERNFAASLLAAGGRALFFGLRAIERNHADAKSALRRCAIYTRKSSEEGLEQDFNSLGF
jgi:hypothetical protein